VERGTLSRWRRHVDSDHADPVSRSRIRADLRAGTQQADRCGNGAERVCLDHGRGGYLDTAARDHELLGSRICQLEDGMAGVRSRENLQDRLLRLKQEEVQRPGLRGTAVLCVPSSKSVAVQRFSRWAARRSDTTVDAWGGARSIVI